MRLLPAVPALLIAACSPQAKVELAKTATGCSVEQATYAERQNGYELRFRPGKPWEMGGSTESVFELVSPKGETAWGYIASNMGTSRPAGSLFLGCGRPGPDDGAMSEEQINACRIWTNVVYALGEGSAEMMPSANEDAPRAILLSDLGRKVRYSDMVMNPGDEPWDVFDFKTCAK
jgi:hypothetical protein